jgi:anti-anti-sigma regulatory factor
MFVKLNTRCRSNKIKLSLLDPSQEVVRLFNLSKMDLIMPIERGENINAIRGEYEVEDYAIDVSRPN